jgi:hypothetical protein
MYRIAVFFLDCRTFQRDLLKRLDLFEKPRFELSLVISIFLWEYSVHFKTILEPMRML